jgi:hypothetical protein
VAGRHDIEHNQGATFRRTLVWRQPASDEDLPETPGDPVDLTGWSARMQLRVEVDADDVALELTTDNGRITLGGPDGDITLRVAAADLERGAIEAGSYRYDLELVDPAGDVTRLIEGKFRIRAEVTR